MTVVGPTPDPPRAQGRTRKHSRRGYQMNGRAIFGCLAAGCLFLGAAARADTISIEQEWTNFARGAGLASPLTPKERACYRNLGSCFTGLSSRDTPVAYYTTRVYFHIAEQIVGGKVDAGYLPNRTSNNYDEKFISAADKAVIQRAIHESANVAIGVLADHEDTTLLEDKWKARARGAGLAETLTPQERSCYENLSACYSDLTAEETPSLYFTTRLYFHICEQVVNGQLEPAYLPSRTKQDVDVKFVTADEDAVIQKALQMGISALLAADHLDNP